MEDVEAALGKSLQLLGGPGALGLPAPRVLIKPNVGVVAGPQSGIITDPFVIEALIHVLKSTGVPNILVAESAIVGVDTKEVFEATGYAAMAERTGVELVDLKETPVEEIPVAKGLIFDRIKIFRPVLEADLVINVPTLKTITAVPVSLGMKNLKGLIPDQEKRRFHYGELNQAIADLTGLIKPGLTIIDGIVGSELYQPKEMNILIAGTDVVSVDVVGSLAMGVDPAQVKYLALAHDQGWGTAALDKIEILGEKLTDLKQSFQQASGNVDGFKKMFPEVDLVAGNVCTSCLSGLNRALTQARKEGLLEKWQGLTLAVGSGARPDAGKRTVCIGNCLKQVKTADYIPGCPFIFLDLLEFLRTSKMN